MSNIHNIGDAKNKKKQQTQAQQGGQVSIDDVSIIACKKEGCNSTIFQPATKWGKLSAAHPANQSGKTGLVPFQTQVCVVCATEMPTVG